MDNIERALKAVSIDIDYGGLNIVIAILEKQKPKVALKRQTDGPFGKGNVYECPSCHNNVRKGQNYCDNCGQALSFHI